MGLRSGGSRPACHVGIVAAVLVSLSTVALAAAQSATLELDPSRTFIRFKLGGVLHTTHGTFALRRGSVRVEPDTGDAEGLIVVDASSGDSGNGARDQRMTDTVLEARRYPNITFSPQRIDGHRDPNGDFHANVTGILQLHGTDHPIVFDAQGHLSGQRLSMTVHLLIPYVEWGLKDPSVLFFAVDKQVEVDVETEGSVTWIP